MSVDPVTFMDTGVTAQFNRYSYTANDPINWTDPNGECPWCVVIAAIYIADKVYGAYDAAQTAKGIADGSIDPVDAAVSQGASQLGGVLAGPIGRQVGKKGGKLFRGAEPGKPADFTPKEPAELRVGDDGFVKSAQDGGRGVSVDSDPNALPGRLEAREIDTSTIPDSLQVTQQGRRATHFEITPAPGAKLTPEEFKDALSCIKCK